MQPREKKLAIAVGALVGVLLVWLAASKIKAAFDTRNAAILKLRDEVYQQEKKIKADNELKQKRWALGQRSLAGNAERAKSTYQSWLLKQLETAGFEKIDVPKITTPPSKGVYQPFAFNITARATMPQLVTWMHAFYRSGHLHLVRKLGITRVEKSKQFDLDMNIEAISLTGAKGNPSPPDQPKRLALGELETYLRVILGRNIAGPPNQPPVLEATTRVPAKLGQSVSFNVRGKDADPLDKLSYKLGDDAPKGATLDAASGKFSWTPPAAQPPGEVKFQVTASDDGYPSRSATQTVTIAFERIGLRLASIGDQKIEPGKEFSTTPRLSEHDPKLTMTFELKGDHPSSLAFDAKTGAIKWTPTESDVGTTLRLSLVATDNATPPNRDEKKFQIAVVAPKVQEFVLDFNAKFTYLTAIVEVEGRPQAWFLVRPTGESIKLTLPAGPGDAVVKLKAGNFMGTLVDVTEDAAILEATGRRLTVQLGKSLADALSAAAPVRAERP